jgi:hypothetical protein
MRSATVNRRCLALASRTGESFALRQIGWPCRHSRQSHEWLLPRTGTGFTKQLADELSLRNPGPRRGLSEPLGKLVGKMDT